MNKYQEALDWVMEGNDSCGTEWDLLQETVDKATPLKPIFLTKTICCSECGTRLGNNNRWTQTTANFCPNCGQKIDWREDE